MYINPKMRNSLYNVDGVEETGKCNGGLVVEGCKHTIFFQLNFFLFQPDLSRGVLK
jgi:hypothetical protein